MTFIILGAWLWMMVCAILLLRLTTDLVQRSAPAVLASDAVAALRFSTVAFLVFITVMAGTFLWK